MSISAKLLIVTFALIILGVMGFFVWRNWQKNKSVSEKPDTTTSETSKSNLYGLMLAYNINDGIGQDKEIMQYLNTGWSEIVKNPAIYERVKSNLASFYKKRNEMIKKSNFSVDREIVGYFTWNVIEPEKGKFNFEITDLVAQAAKDVNIKFSAVVQPFASWDQTNSQIDKNQCRALDFAYYDYKAGPPSDLEEYKIFLTKIVERYQDQVAYWEIGNEYDGPCGGYQNNPQGYLELLKTSSEVIKKVDPNAKVVNGGALEINRGTDQEEVRNFWQKFFQLGGSNYLDYFNWHYNSEKSEGAKSDPNNFLEHLDFFTNLMETNGGKKPMIITEFGTYYGTPSMQPGGQTQQVKGTEVAKDMQSQPNQMGPQQPGGSQQSSLPNQSEDFQRAWYFKYSILAFTGGVEIIFLDFAGDDQSAIGKSMMYNPEEQARPFVVTIKAISDKISNFSRAEKISDGQYKFTVDDRLVYALWNGKIPSEIANETELKITDSKDQEQTLKPQEIKFSSDNPIFIETK